ncbi:MAG: hypothetical protein CFE21_10565 [Bacteroidetes bacterium B1(2017)]|nr:MAG: hypothetical protein CFE21_10565 [Bacteroidetes bacterium B1(2017)]
MKTKTLFALLLWLFGGSNYCLSQTIEEDSIIIGRIQVDSIYSDAYDIQLAEKMPTSYISINNIIGENNVENLGKKISVSYAFTNPKSEPIVIKRISVNCACIETIFPKTIINGGQTGVITFNIEIMEPGPFKASAVVYASDESLRFIKIIRPITITN